MKNILQKLKPGKDFSELLLHSKNYILAQFFTLGLAFITMPIFTRLMSPEEYGVLSVFTSFEGVVAIIFGLGVRGAITRYYWEDKDDFFEYLSSNIWLILIVSCTITLSSLLFINSLQKFLNIPLGMIFIAFAIAVPQALFQLYKAYLQAAKKSKKVATLNAISAVIGTGLAIIIMVQMTKERYYAKAIGQSIAALVMLVLTIWYLRKNISFHINKTHLKYSLVYGLPIILHLLSQNILNTFDQIIINQLVGGHETGLYSVAYKIGMIQSMVTMGILKAWTPMFYEKLNKNKIDEINILARKYAYIVMLVAVALIFFSREIIVVLADKRYHEALGIIPVIIISYFFFFLYTMYVNYAFYEKKTKNIALITIIAGGLNISLNYLLIPKFGYIAAAWTTLISYFALFILHYINVKYIIKIDRTTDIKIFVLPLIILSFMGFLNYYLISINISHGFSIIIRILIFAFVIMFTLKKIIKSNTQ